ncbi:hypothetical protein U1E44_12920 [Arenibacter sp. GZD96]|uniref:ThuA domain-containing protein n=1 Tax=Aurantibrevibacter litoralis TaxID=3106030 RepID=UPI002AFEEF89|nr:hypothetical protein [Arenibacter sp. GZD-96]MEA1786998.1 hypothetical protein [Arenibacter sp. GZD-96]
MKKIVCVCICLALAGCLGKPNSSTAKQEPTQWLTFSGGNENAKHIVLISGDQEYRSEEALPQLAKILSQRHGFKCTVLFAQDPAEPGIINPKENGHIPGLEALQTADLMFIFTRFTALPDEQMKHIDEYLIAGKPVVGIRTATHAFNFPEGSNSAYTHYGNGYNGEKTEWKDGFGRLVLGEKWIAHHGHHKHQSTRGVLAENIDDKSIANGIADGDIWGPTDVYEVRLPLPGDAQPIILGQVINRAGTYDEDDLFYGMKPTDSVLAKTNDQGISVNDILMPIAWTKSYQLPGGKKGKAFTSTIGAASDLLNEGTRRLLVNAVYWTLDVPVPEKADVSLVGTYQPTAYEFKTDDYWKNRKLNITDLE